MNELNRYKVLVRREAIASLEYEIQSESQEGARIEAVRRAFAEDWDDEGEVTFEAEIEAEL